MRLCIPVLVGVIFCVSAVNTVSRVAFVRSVGSSKTQSQRPVRSMKAQNHFPARNVRSIKLQSELPGRRVRSSKTEQKLPVKIVRSINAQNQLPVRTIRSATGQNRRPTSPVRSIKLQQQVNVRNTRSIKTQKQPSDEAIKSQTQLAVRKARSSKTKTELPANPTFSPELLTQMKIEKERRERRILRKKKEKLRGLRAEIRQLSRQIQGAGGRQRSPSRSAGRDDVRWRKKLLEKMKTIIRRLDRIEGRTSLKKQNIKHLRSQVVRTSKTLSPTGSPIASTTLSTTTPIALHTSIHPPEDKTDKLRRIQSSIEQARSGDNGTACATHKDCKPGRCCHRVELKSMMQSQCVWHAVPEGVPCLDSCQCAHTLHCFLPSNNSTVAHCKKADSQDILHGSYLYKKNAVFADKNNKKK